jgi:P27 family predicted phage terminase small subunit
LETESSGKFLLRHFFLKKELMNMSNKKKSTELKLLRGTFRKHREVGGAPLCECNKIPEPPEFLSAEALKEWHRIAPELYAVGLLTQMDGTALAVYCLAYGRYRQALLKMQGQELVISTKAGTQVRNPLLRIADQAADLLLKVAKEFGMTPASRSKVSAKQKKAKDQWEEFE